MRKIQQDLGIMDRLGVGIVFARGSVKDDSQVSDMRKGRGGKYWGWVVVALYWNDEN